MADLAGGSNIRLGGRFGISHNNGQYHKSLSALDLGQRPGIASGIREWFGLCVEINVNHTAGRNHEYDDG